MRCLGVRNARAYRGADNPRWKGGEISDGHGRVMVYMPGHPLATMLGNVYAYRYRLVAEEKLGRPLKKGEIVHHINGDQSDDRPDNLAVLPNQSAHARIEDRQRFSDEHGNRTSGVSKRSGGGWRARANVSGKDVWLGAFRDKESAHAAVNEYWRRM